jgi:hypothetical protein
MSSPDPLILKPAEATLLLYLEHRLVEHRGGVPAGQLRPEELALAERWHREHLIQLTALPPQDIDYRQTQPTTHRVSFSERAWALAFATRRARSVREREQFDSKTERELDNQRR